MSKKDFIALADVIRATNRYDKNYGTPVFNPAAIERLARFCQSQNPFFNRSHWLDYVAGKSGPSGGKL